MASIQRSKHEDTERSRINESNIRVCENFQGGEVSIDNQEVLDDYPRVDRFHAETGMNSRGVNSMFKSEKSQGCENSLDIEACDYEKIWKKKFDSVFGTIASTLEVMDRSQASIDADMKTLSHEDCKHVTKMTLSRRIVEKYLLNLKWYNPKAALTTSEDATQYSTPDLRLAWAFFEHIVLPRRLDKPNNEAPRFERAQPGELDQRTALYSPWSLPESELSKWGLSFRLYFAKIRILGILFLVLGCLNLINVAYFSSTAYNQDVQGQSSLSLYLKGTAICTDRQWVPCPNCTFSQWESHPTAFATDQASGMNFVERNACANGATILQGMINYVSIIFMNLSLLCLGYYHKRIQRRNDDQEISATDYSIYVKNPPPDARDPQLWRDFFNRFESDNKQVVAITIELKNQKLINALLQRRRIRKQLHFLLGSQINLDDKIQDQNYTTSLDMKAPPRDDVYIPPSSAPKGTCSFTELLRKLFLKPLGLALTPAELFLSLKNLEKKIRDLHKLEYPVSKVFVTFETKAGQQKALKTLSSSWFNIKNDMEPSSLFQGKVLNVAKPKEPTSIRWTDSGVPNWIKYSRRMITNISILGLVVLNILILYISRKYIGPEFAANLLSIFNYAIPYIICRTISFDVPSHEDHYQLFLFYKLIVFRWINTVFVVFMITPFTSTLTESDAALLPTIGKLFYNEIWLTPLLCYCDPWGNFHKHIWAPRCRTQEGMNSCFKTEADALAARYTDFMRIVLLVCFYSPIYPSAYLLGSVALTLQYWMDKFRLLRSWPRQAMIGGKLAASNSIYSFSTLMVISTISATYFWSGFSFDNVCESGDSFCHNGSVPVTLGSGDQTEIRVNSTHIYKYCRQNLFKTQGPSHPPLTSEKTQNAHWMTNEQAIVTFIIGWTSFIILIAWALWVGGMVTLSLLFKRTTRKVSQEKKVDFSQVLGLNAYVPQISVSDINYPLIICDIDSVHPHLVGWRDARNGFDKHNMYFDLPRMGGMRRVRQVNEEGQPMDVVNYDIFLASEGGTQSQKIFSLIKHWPMNVALADEDVPQSQDVTKSQIRVIKNWPLNQGHPHFAAVLY